MLTGCGKEVEVKNGSKVAVSLDKNKYTATEYYEKIKEANISTLIDTIDHDLFDAIDVESDSICICRKYITSEPMSYPCIFTWTCIDNDNPEYRGEFIYPQDFKYMKRYGDK